MEEKFLTTSSSPTPVIVQAPSIVTISEAGTIKATYQDLPTPNAASPSTQPRSKAASDTATQKLR